MSLSPSPPLVPRKKLFKFKRANLGAPTETNNKDDLGFFSRREQNYSAVTDNPKKEPKNKTKKSHAPEDPGEGGGSPPKRTKRRSFTGDDEDSGENISGTQRLHADARQRYKNAIVLSDSDDPPKAKNSRPPKSKSKNRESRLTPPPILNTDNVYPESVSCTTHSSSSPSSSSPSSSPPNPPPSHTASSSQNTSSLKQATPISDDDDDVALVANKSPTPTPAPVSEEDEYIAALEKRARERALAQRTSSAPSLTSPPPVDPVVSILVSSKIEGTKPLVLRRRVNQPLKPVRTIWCEKQNFTEDQAADIFLTWQGNKVFDHNSCRGIGIAVDDLDGQEGTLDSNIYFEAMTAEGFAEMERERERGYSVSGVEEEEEEVPEKEEVVMRLTLKSKGYEDFRIKVRPETKISKLVSAFRIAWKVPDDKEITLDFDGDNLDPEETVGGTELEDMFGIDVYVS